jgi:hypothetical protein
MPSCAGLSGQAIAIDIGPSSNELPVKSLPVETGASQLDGFNELRKERPHSKTILEGDGGWLSVVGSQQPDADFSPAISDRSD